MEYFTVVHGQCIAIKCNGNKKFFVLQIFSFLIGVILFYPANPFIYAIPQSWIPTKNCKALCGFRFKIHLNQMIFNLHFQFFRSKVDSGFQEYLSCWSIVISWMFINLNGQHYHHKQTWAKPDAPYESIHNSIAGS